MCVMEPVTYDLDIKLTCIMLYIVDSYVLIYADALFETFEQFVVYCYLIYGMLLRQSTC